MLVPTIIMAVLAIALMVVAYYRGGTPQITGGLKAAGNMLLQMAPLLIFAMIIAGIIPMLVPAQKIAGWVGAESGWRGILIGSAVGGLMPGGPFVSLPIAAGLMRVGAGIGTMVALITGWSLLAFSRLPMEIGIMGWRFTLIRLACTFFFAPVSGFLASWIFSRVGIV
jgi:uncharacterized membrane protein YraQ (UPF0718 family)